MLAFGKCLAENFRYNTSEFKRKDPRLIWKGNFMPDIASVVRLAPSGCNLQPWRFSCAKNEIIVYRNVNMKKFPAKKKALYDETDFSFIDMGIVLHYLEIALKYKQFKYIKIIRLNYNPEKEEIEVAKYCLK